MAVKISPWLNCGSLKMLPSSIAKGVPAHILGELFVDFGRALESCSEYIWCMLLQNPGDALLLLRQTLLPLWFHG